MKCLTCREWFADALRQCPHCAGRQSKDQSTAMVLTTAARQCHRCGTGNLAKMLSGGVWCTFCGDWAQPSPRGELDLPTEQSTSPSDGEGGISISFSFEVSLPAQSPVRQHSSGTGGREENRTKRPLNRCADCRRTWYPRGSDRSTRCPECGSESVQIEVPTTINRKQT